VRQKATISASTCSVGGVAREAEGGFHDQRVGLAPFRGLGGKARAELEVAGVEQRAGVCFDIGLGGAEDVAGREQGDRKIAEGAPFPEREEVLAPLPADPRLHQPGGGRAGDDLRVARCVITVRVRDEGQRLGGGGVEPEVVRGQVNAAAVANVDHAWERLVPRSAPVGQPANHSAR
jgi:hypothetical protein